MRQCKNLALISALFLTFASCSQKYSTIDGFTWGTTYHIVYSDSKDYRAEIEAEMALVDRELSMFNPSSTVSRINAGATDSVSAAFADVFEISVLVNGLSGGMYDPTVAPLTDLWGFGRKGADVAEPGDSAIAVALATVGIADCAIDSCGILHRKSADTAFDFSSVAKGYGVDRIATLLEGLGCSNYMIEIGGEIAARGKSPRGGSWRIQVDSPEGGAAHSRMEVMEIGPERTAVATSGNYRRRRPVAGGSIGHTVSPISGYPVEAEVVSATVIHPSCAVADALATACMAVARADSALALLEHAGADGLIASSTTDSLIIQSTSSRSALLRKESTNQPFN